jgi:signal transduction histidine kinase
VESNSGFNISHPQNPQLEGTSTINQVDANGKMIVQEMIDLIEHTGFGFLEYSYANPGSGAVELKTTFVKSIPEAGWYLGSGFYHHDGGLLTAGQVNEMIVKQAVESMAGGLGNIFETHVTDSLQGVELMRDFLRHIRFFDDHSGYFYVIDFNGYNVVQPPDPSIQGTYEWDIQDSRGNYLVRGLVETAQNGGGYYSYYWPDYEAGSEKLKKAYVKQIPGKDYLIGSGVYSAE